MSGGGFNFALGGSSTSTPSTGFSFTAPTTTATTASSTPGFTFGSKPAASTAGFSFGDASSQVQQSSGFTLGSTAAATTTGNTLGSVLSTQAQPAGATLHGTGLQSNTFGTAVAKFPPGSGFSLGTTSTPAKPTTGFTFGAATPAKAGTGVSSFSSPATTSAGGTQLLGGGQPASSGGVTTTTASSGFFNLTPAKTQGTQPSGFSLPASATTGSNQSSVLVGGATAQTVGTKPSFTPTVTPSGGLTLGAKPVQPAATVSTATTTASSGMLFGSVSAPFVASTKTTTSLSQNTTTTTTTTITSSSSTAGVTPTTTTTITYKQLEDNINKWMKELDEQEHIFIQQATQVNAWDRQLMENGEKITQLNSDVERVKADQQRLEHELDFIVAQQKELEEVLVPLEKAVDQLPSITYQQHADLEREHTYQMAENIDAQLKRMAQDLKEIIDHVNASNSAQDANDPINQIAKILNAHMDSLQWVDQNVAHLQRKVDEVSKLTEHRRREQERNFRMAYN